MRLASFLISTIIGSAVFPAGPLGATGLYDDLPSFFSMPDTARVLFIRHTECDLGGWRASLLTGGFTVRPARRFELRFDLQFPAVRRPHEIAYGVGDMLLRTATRISGDTLNASGLFLRFDLRIPSGSKGLRPFSNGSFEGEAGLEVRVARGAFAVQGALLHTLAGETSHGTDFVNERHFTLAASVGIPVPRVLTMRVSAFFMGFNGGDARSVFLLSIERELSRQLVLALTGAFETGNEGARAFDSCASIAFMYRFPPRPVTPPPDSDQP